jgi:hypothetical protein
MKQTFNVTGIKLRSYDPETKRSGILKELPPRQIEVEFPDDYNHMNSTDSPICEALEIALWREGHRFATVDYEANLVGGETGEIRVTISMTG